MAGSAVALGRAAGRGAGRAVGWAAAGLVAALVLVPLLALWLTGEAGRGLAPQHWAAIRFTLVQALLSATISCLLAVPLARALARRRWPGRNLALSLLGAPFLLPVIVAIIGILVIWGRSGVVSGALGALGLPPVSIYGLGGVVLAHVFFNLPLATRLVLSGWAAVPPEQLRLAAQIGARGRAHLWLIEWPVLRGALPGAFAMVFLFCASSFAVALTLGGGPRATTVELAIYQALRLEFDLRAAALLGLVQFALAGGVALLALSAVRAAPVSPGLGLAPLPWPPGGLARLGDLAVLLLAALFLGLPLLAVLARGASGVLAGLPPQVWPALARSVAVAVGSGVLMLALALPLAHLIDTMGGRAGRALDGAVTLALAASPLVIGTGLFIVVHPVTDPGRLALPVTILVNAGLALPIALRILLPALARIRHETDRLCAGLGMAGRDRVRLVTWPRLRPEIGFAAGLGAALSMGDLGVIALFAPAEGGTLPLIVLRLMGAYRMEAAAGAALVLVLASFGLFWLCDRWGRQTRRPR